MIWCLVTNTKLRYVWMIYRWGTFKNKNSSNQYISFEFRRIRVIGCLFHPTNQISPAIKKLNWYRKNMIWRAFWKCLTFYRRKIIFGGIDIWIKLKKLTWYLCDWYCRFTKENILEKLHTCVIFVRKLLNEKKPWTIMQLFIKIFQRIPMCHLWSSF